MTPGLSFLRPATCQEGTVETLTKYLAVAGGGAAGAMLRYYLSGSILARTAAPFPTATFVINITGSFIIGLFLTLVAERVPVNPNVRLAIAVGFVGAYTTFSTFEYETARLIEGKDYLYAFLNVGLSLAVGFAAVWAGIVTARRVAGLPITSHAAYGKLDEQVEPSEPAQSARTGLDTGASGLGVDDEQKDEAHTRKRA
jgi:fluoride exporter